MCVCEREEEARGARKREGDREVGKDKERERIELKQIR